MHHFALHLIPIPHNLVHLPLHTLFIQRIPSHLSNYLFTIILHHHIILLLLLQTY